MNRSAQGRADVSAVAPTRSAQPARGRTNRAKRTQTRPAFHPSIRRCAFARSGAQRVGMKNRQNSRILRSRLDPVSPGSFRRDAHVLRLREESQRLLPTLAANAALLGAAEGGPQ